MRVVHYQASRRHHTGAEKGAIENRWERINPLHKTTIGWLGEGKRKGSYCRRCLDLGDLVSPKAADPMIPTEDRLKSTRNSFGSKVSHLTKCLYEGP